MTVRAKKAVVLAVLVTPLFIGGAQAATWNNSGTDFNASASWSGALLAGQTAVFPGSPGKQPNLSDNFTASALSFSSGASGYDITATSPFALTLTTTAASGAISGLNTSGTNTIDAPLVLGAAAAAGLTQSFYQAAGGTLVVNGAISNTNSVSLKITGTTSSTKRSVVTLAGANSYRGGTTLDGVSTLNINNGGTGGTSSAIGTGDFMWSAGATINNTHGSRVALSTDNKVIFNNTGTYTFTGSDDLDFGLGIATVNDSITLINKSQSGKTLTFGSLVNNKSASITLAVTVTPDAAVVFDGFILNNKDTGLINNIVQGSGSVKFTGVISDGNLLKNSLTYRGTGKLQLGGANTYRGTTTVESGTVQLDGNTIEQGYFLVQPSDYTTVAPQLTGTGTIGLDRIQGLMIRGGKGFTETYSATLNPGDISTASATLRIGTYATNKVIFADGSVLAIDINGNDTDTLAITGDLDLSSTSNTLLIKTSGSQALGRYVFATYTGSLDTLTSRFAAVIYNGSSLPANLSIDYSNREIALVGLPEPTGMSFLLGSAGAGLLIRRRARQA